MRSFNMLPPLPGDNHRNGRRTNPIPCSHLFLRDSAGNQAPDFANIIFSKNRVRAMGPSGNTPFHIPITGVIGRRAKKKMIGAYASGGVATVAYEKTLRDRPVVQLVRQSMSCHRSLVDSHQTVARAAFCASPEPAGISLCHFGPEPSFDWSNHRGVVAAPATVNPVSVSYSYDKGMEYLLADGASTGGTLTAHSGLLSRVWGAMLRGVSAPPGLSVVEPNFTMYMGKLPC